MLRQGLRPLLARLRPARAAGAGPGGASRAAACSILLEAVAARHAAGFCLQLLADQPEFLATSALIAVRDRMDRRL